MLGCRWSAWKAGDRKAALAAVPDSLVDELFIHGTPEQRAARVADYVRAGVTTPMLSLSSLDGDPASLIPQFSRALIEGAVGS